MGCTGSLGRAREGEGVGESGPCGGVKGEESGPPGWAGWGLGLSFLLGWVLSYLFLLS